MSTLHVLDGTAALFRAYFGRMRLTSPSGVEVGAVLGQCSTFARFVRTISPTHVAVVFDAGPKTFRNELDPSYKANRGDPPDDLVPQFDLAQRAASALGASVFSLVGYEADDLMATLARWGLAHGMEVSLVSGDKDLLQLVRPGVRVVHPKDLRQLDAAWVEERYGVRPEQMVDLLAMIGDSSDNIPGIRGVGQKSAAALLRAFGDLEGIYAHIEDILYLDVRGARSLQGKVVAGREVAVHCRELVRLRDDVPDPAIEALAGPEDLRWTGPSAEADALFDEMGFHGPLRSLRAM